MPRAKDPLQDLKAHRDRQAEMQSKEEGLRSDAVMFLGELMMKEGLGDWPTRDLKTLIACAGKMGRETALAALSGKGAVRPSRTEGKDGEQAKLEGEETASSPAAL